MEFLQHSLQLWRYRSQVVHRQILQAANQLHVSALIFRLSPKAS
jgi:hypothetical protein